MFVKVTVDLIVIICICSMILVTINLHFKFNQNASYEILKEIIMDKVSIVVPIYNMERFLERCMKTLIAQTYKNIEIILINDGSTDHSKFMCDRYASAYPQLIKTIHKENGGLSSARNVGINIAQGKYIIFPDPDDWVETTYVEKAMEIQMKYDPTLVCVGYNITYDDKCIPANNGYSFMKLNQNEAKKSLISTPAMGGFAWNKLYHLDIIKKYDLRFHDDVGTTEDLEFAFQYLRYCKSVYFAPEIRTYNYYQREGAATYGHFSKKKVDSIRTYDRILNDSGTDLELIKIVEEEICNTAINLCWLYKRDHCHDHESWELIRRYLKKYIVRYLMSERYSKGRKLQAILAFVMPNVYVKVKNFVQRRGGC